MAYQATLNGTQQVTIANPRNQTQITLIANSPGRQQSQSSSFTTGTWTKPPQLFSTGQGFMLQIEGEQGQYYIQIQSNSISTINGIPSIQNATPVKLRIVDDIPDIPSPPSIKFKPMQPMKMGNMSMDINSMSMRMGNMSLNLGNRSKTTIPEVFCSQCGIEAKAGDRFCRSCGEDLDQ